MEHVTPIALPMPASRIRRQPGRFLRQRARGIGDRPLQNGSDSTARAVAASRSCRRTSEGETHMRPRLTR